MTINYRTSDGQADYQFSFERLGPEEWRAYIVWQPSYAGRSEDPNTIHRLTYGGRKYVCWDRPLKSEADARQVAGEWADRTQEYIRSGRLFS